jgi:hypothetical protein
VNVLQLNKGEPQELSVVYVSLGTSADRGTCMDLLRTLPWKKNFRRTEKHGKLQAQTQQEKYGSII